MCKLSGIGAVKPLFKLSLWSSGFEHLTEENLTGKICPTEIIKFLLWKFNMK
jgi:hypothetical protein